MPRVLAVVACLILLASGEWAAAAQIGVKPVYTNKTKFRIPYRYNPQEMQRLQAREIRLYTSIDGGVRWQLSQTVAPNAQKFEFEAPRDGEYWFAVRTLDGNNQLHPGGDTFSAGLKVIVDTTDPLLKLHLRQSEAGRVELSWSAVDSHLDANQLHLEYMQPGNKEWETIRVVPAENGQTSWSVPGGGIVAVRGLVKDQAGNQGTGQMQIAVDPADAAVPRPARPDFRKPVAENLGPGGTEMGDRFPGLKPATQPPSVATASPAITPQRQFPTSDNLGPQPFPETVERPVADNTESRPDALKGRYDMKPQKPFEPSGVVKVVSSTQFQLGYQLEDVGPSGVSAVELFITQDDGEHWWRYGSDDDHESPFQVDVPIEGIYGFALRVKSGAGLTQDPPTNSEKPEMSVIVDQTPPTAELVSVQPRSGEGGGEVILRWNVSDPYPSGAPVAVSYAVKAEGPWIPITGWQPDQGGFVWKVGRETPPKVFLKLEARDAAGNMSQVVSDKPISIDQSRPSARIVDVETQTESGFRE